MSTVLIRPPLDPVVHGDDMPDDVEEWQVQVCPADGCHVMFRANTEAWVERLWRHATTLATRSAAHERWVAGVRRAVAAKPKAEPTPATGHEWPPMCAGPPRSGLTATGR